MRWYSPPLKLFEGLYKVRYVNPTSNKKSNRSLISFNTSFAILFCFWFNLFSISANQCASLSKSIALISAIFFSSTLNQRLSFFNLVPRQESHGFNVMNFSTHSLNASVVVVAVNHLLIIFIIPS